MKKGFALIYVLVITAIMMTTITSILTLGSSDIRQKNKVLYTAGAWQMAQSGIEDGIANYKKDTANCGKSGFYNVKNNTYAASRMESPRTNDPATDDQGDYTFTIACSPVSITAIGYSKGSKVKMKADIVSADNTKWNIYQVGF